ncbi:MAG: SDR family oxidoreductase [Actinomycetota bacterium]
MELGLKGKVAWVLGGSSGLGRASAHSLAREGALVAISSRDENALREAATHIESDTGSRCIAIPLDVMDSQAIAEAHKKLTGELGPVDVLVANAGGPPAGSFEDLDDETMQGAFNLTTASAWRLAHAVTPSMQERGSGAILFLTSTSTKEVVGGLLLSNMMRAAVVGMAKTMSKELGAHGIRVLCVAPGRVATKRLEELDAGRAAKTGETVEEVGQSWADMIPLGRYGKPVEFGDVVAFAASERASYVTGTTIMVDGGLTNSTHA